MDKKINHHHQVVARISQNYSDMETFISLETGKYGIREWLCDNGTQTDTTGALLETQMSGYFLTGYVPFLTIGSYAQAQDESPPTSVTNASTATGNFYINNTWTNPADASHSIKDTETGQVFAEGYYNEGSFSMITGNMNGIIDRPLTQKPTVTVNSGTAAAAQKWYCSVKYYFR
ncbi:MAG: hypothetical protein WC623_22375 [Pedobacter sp.]|uniref:hypothetical protein n=1 Tax=Pedobacter sp. TaxID=1411316 RepID=UPI00356A7085